MRMENLLWRMIAPPFARKTFKGHGPSVAIDVKYIKLASTVGNFFKQPNEFGSKTSTYSKFLAKQIERHIPSILTEYATFAPPKKLAELIILANTSIEFTENSLVMALVSFIALQ